MNELHGKASLRTVQHLLGHCGHAVTADVYGTVADALARAEAMSTAEVFHRDATGPTCGGAEASS